LHCTSTDIIKEAIKIIIIQRKAKKQNKNEKIKKTIYLPMASNNSKKKRKTTVAAAAETETVESMETDPEAWIDMLTTTTTRV